MPRRRAATKKVRYSKVKQMVTGHGPTMLERIAAGASGAANVARAVMPIVAAINTESKYYDSTGTGTFFQGTDAIVNLTGGIAQGLTDITRIGNSILAQNINIRLYALKLFTAAINQGIGRITLVCWKENFQQNPLTTAKFFETTNVLSAFNKDYTDQFVILKDKIFTFSNPSNLATNQNPHVFKIFKKLNFHMRFDAAAANTHTMNHIYLIFRSNASAAGDQNSFEHYTRLNYTDN